MSSDLALKVENIGKKYSIGKQKDDNLRSALANLLKSNNSKGKEFWALKDVSFEVKQGDVIGIIGKNGAGKSTLLKILSQITRPTTGRIEINGRVASLLEVGTGFHPELTGRENIYLNGTILGMSRREVKLKFDEIVDFSGVEEFIDTPVKHYSSGMYVRLAFAVAAHLEPEILIIDEVLSVGDAEFQKKCLGKMGEVASQGRTVIFVSHNMSAVKSLCHRGLVLKDGTVTFIGDSDSAVDFYMQGSSNLSSFREWSSEEMPGNENIKIRRALVYAKGKSADDPILTKDDLVFEIEFYNNLDNAIVDVTWDLMNVQGIHVAHIGRVCDNNGISQGWHKSTAVLPKDILNTERYIFSVMFGLNQKEVLYQMEDILTFDMNDGIENRGNNFNKLPGVIHPICNWQTEMITDS